MTEEILHVFESKYVDYLLKHHAKRTFTENAGQVQMAESVDTLLHRRSSHRTSFHEIGSISLWYAS